MVLYWTLTGVLPFRGSQQMLLHQVLEEDPKPPRAVNELIPRDLEVITLRAMSKEPADRFATAEEFADELKRWLDGRAIVSRPVSAGEKIWKWCRRNPVWTALSGLIGALLCCVVVLFAQRIRAEAQLVVQQETALSGVADNLIVRAVEEANGVSPIHSLPHLVEALQMRQTLEQPQRAQRTRRIIGQTFDHLPAVTHFTALDQRADELKYFPAGNQLFVCYGTRIDRVSTDSWETASSMQLADRTRELIFSTAGDRMISLPSQIVEITSEQSPSQSRQTELWDAENGRRLALLKIEGQTSDATFARNDSVVVTCRTEGSAYAWDANSGALLAALQMPGNMTTHVWPSPDGESVYVDAHYYDGRPSRITRFSTDNWQPTAQYQIGDIVNQADTLLFDEQITAVTRFGDLIVLIEEPEDSDVAGDDAAPPEKTTSIADLADGSDQVHSIQQLTPQILAVKTNTEVFTWDLQQQERRYTLSSGDATEERLFEVSDNGLIYAVMKAPETLAVRWVDDGHPVCTSLPVTGTVTAVTIAANRFVVTATEDGAMTVWDLAGLFRGRQPLLCGLHAKLPAFVPDGSAMMAIVDDTLHVWSAAAPAEPLWTAGAAVAAVSATGQIATVLDSQIELHDPATGEVTDLLQTESEVTHLVFAVDNNGVLIAGQADGKLTAWNTQRDSVVTIAAHTSSVTALASGAGGMVASGGEDGVIRRWNIVDGAALGDPLACDPVVRSLSFSADGQRLGATRINEYQIWQAASGKLLHSGSTSASRAGVLFDDNSADYWAADDDSRLARWSGLHERVATADGRDVTRSARVKDGSLLAFNSRRDGANSMSLIFADDLTLMAPPLPFRSGAEVAFAPDGQSLLAATYTGRVDLIRIVTTKLPVADLERLCSVMTHDCYVDNVLTRIPSLQIRDEFRQLKIDQPKLLKATDEDVARWNIRLQQERDNLHWQPTVVQ
ncbi:MAG: hypothetical protein NXI04_11670 [Planctomycetaceae bacterium]|nr:hypothetical protein [Planctomycetaceae bacterium]